MSKENRLREYKRLLAQNRLSQDDGALAREFGTPDKPEPKGEPVKGSGMKVKKNG